MPTHALKLSENFLNITEFRQKLSVLASDFAKDQPKGSVEVSIVTEHGKPVATVMGYQAYERIRELLFLLQAQADVESGRVMSFKAGTSAKEALDAIFKEDPGERRRTTKDARPT